MPDRITNHVITDDGQILCRPSPVSGFQDEMGDLQIWWPLWKLFMFRTPILVAGRSHRNVFALLENIPRAKYPALTIAEEAASIPLQILCLALFDAILTHLLSLVARDIWQPVRRALCRSHLDGKSIAAASILRSSYSFAQVIFVQEASADFAARAAIALPAHFVLRPAGADGRRPQLSLIIARRDAFDFSTAVDLNGQVTARLPRGSVAPGDLCVFAVRGLAGRPPLVLASFHGDSDGLSTSPVLAALCAVAAELCPGHGLLIGLDANVPSAHSAAPPEAANAPAVQGAVDRNVAAPTADKANPAARPQYLEPVIAGLGLSSCWDGHQDREGLWTVFRARTTLQPQLHKAVGPAAARGREHLQLRDWILSAGPGFEWQSAGRDNTGRALFIEPAAAVAAAEPGEPALGQGPGPGRFPVAAAEFPSDHVIVFATLAMAGAQ